MEKKYDFYCQEVLSGNTPVEKIYEDGLVLAYYHTKPFWEKHIVIIPKKHISNLSTFEDEDLEILSRIMIVARTLSKKLDFSKWVQLLTNMWKFQDTPHLHFHLIEGKKLK